MTHSSRIATPESLVSATYRYYAPRGGWRYVVLYRKGRKWLRLLDTATLEVYKVPVFEFRRLRPYRMARRTLAARLVKRRDAFRRYGRRFSERAVKATIQVLRRC